MVKNVALIGAETSGGLADIGLAVARALSFSFHDVDSVVAGSADMTAEEIFEQEGEFGYLIRESLAVYALVSVGKGVVVTVGRKALDAHETTDALHVHCVTVYVKGDEGEAFDDVADITVTRDADDNVTADNIVKALNEYRGV